MKFVLKPFKIEINVSAIVNVHFFEFPKTFRTEKDAHPFSELLYVESGSIKVLSDKYNGILKKGEMLIHRPNEEHFLTNTDKPETKVIIIGFECVSNDINVFSHKPYKLNADNTEKLARIVREGRNVFDPPYNVPVYDMKEKTHKPYGSMQLLKILIEEFLITLIRETRFNEMSASENHRLAVAEIIKYLDDNFKEKISLDELAFLFGTNRSTLCKIFKENTGKTVGEYIIDKKIEFAKKEISSMNKTFSEISEEMNFESIHYFSNFFKKQMGISPKLYRRNTLESK